MSSTDRLVNAFHSFDTTTEENTTIVLTSKERALYCNEFLAGNLAQEMVEKI